MMLVTAVSLVSVMTDVLYPCMLGTCAFSDLNQNAHAVCRSQACVVADAGRMCNSAIH